jgi:hypothetical protein
MSPHEFYCPALYVAIPRCVVMKDILSQPGAPGCFIADLERTPAKIGKLRKQARVAERVIRLRTQQLPITSVLNDRQAADGRRHPMAGSSAAPGEGDLLVNRFVQRPFRKRECKRI